jgi:catalase
MRFTNEDGVSRHGRYRILPESGAQHLSADEGRTKPADFLFEELAQRLTTAPVRFRIVVQLANEGDIVTDATFHWPEDREIAEFGPITLTHSQALRRITHPNNRKLFSIRFR